MKIVIQEYSEIKKLSPFDGEALLRSLQYDLFEKKHFDICVLDQASKVLGIQRQVRDSPEYEVLRMMHCHDYHTMTKEFKYELWRKSLRLLGFDLETREASPAEKSADLHNKNLLAELYMKMTKRIKN